MTNHLETRILFHAVGGDADGDQQDSGSDGTQLLELSVPQRHAKDPHEIDGAGDVSDQMTNGHHPTCFRISMSVEIRKGDEDEHFTPCRAQLLFLDWESVDDQTATAGLHCIASIISRMQGSVRLVVGPPHQH